MKKAIESYFGMRTFCMLIIMVVVALGARLLGLDDGAAVGLFGLALAADKALEYTEGVEVGFPVDDGDKIYAGALVCVNADGYAVPGGDTAGLIFVGVAIEQVDNTLGQDGDKTVRVRRRGLINMELASAISLQDVEGFTAKENAEEALAEIYQHLKSAKGIIPIPMPVITDAGVALAAFQDGDSTTPGYCATAKGLGIRWNNHATPGAVGAKVVVPPDMDVTANAVLHILAAKTGATLGDATKFTVAAYNNVKAAAYDADEDFGGDTGAMTGDATAKHVQEVTLTLALANLAAYPAAIELTIKPKAGTLGTDDVIMLGAWIEYKKKLLTA